MARRALTVCSVPGCPHAMPCAEHPARNGSTRAWRRVRLAVLRRDGFRCPCGAVAVEVDHVVPRELGGADVPGNLRSLCADCHAARHGRACSVRECHLSEPAPRWRDVGLRFARFG